MHPHEPAAWWSQAPVTRRPAPTTGALLCQLTLRFLRAARDSSASAKPTYAALVALASADLESRMTEVSFRRRHGAACRRCLSELSGGMPAQGGPVPAHAADGLIALLCELHADEGRDTPWVVEPREPTTGRPARRASGRDAKALDHLAVQQRQA